jgi:8-amino-7-oxononanoate synthase
MCASLTGGLSGLENELGKIKEAGLYRKCKVFDSAQGPVVSHAGRQLLNFCSNDYLGLANHPRLRNAMINAVEKYGLGSGASQLVCGRNTMHVALEEALAAFTGREKALVFSSGYMANLSVVSTLCPGREDLVIEDRLNHASMIDGARLSGARLKRYHHADPDSLGEILSAQGRGKKLMVLTDGVFSMDGDIAPLEKMVQVCAQHQADLAVDDAHGLGVLGKTGRGVLEHYGLTQAEVPVLVGTFGKALGAFGAFVAGSAELVEYLVQKARPYIYTTALPAAICAAVIAALELIDEEPWRRDKLHELTAYFRAGMKQRGLPVAESYTPIQPLIVGEAARAVALSDKLLEAGILISAMRPPTVPAGSSRLRITFSAAHSIRQVDALLEALAHHAALLRN